MRKGKIDAVDGKSEESTLVDLKFSADVEENAYCWSYWSNELFHIFTDKHGKKGKGFLLIDHSCKEFFNAPTRAYYLRQILMYSSTNV